jgi:hypothetical protein
LVDLSRPIKTVSGNDVRNLVQEKRNCNCSLSNSNIIGEVSINGSWHLTKWSSNGNNLSGIRKWDLMNL